MRKRRGVGLRSIRARGTVLVFAIAAIAVGGVYLYVVPRLRSRLVSERLDTLDVAARRYAPRLGPLVASDLTSGEVARPRTGGRGGLGHAGHAPARRPRERRDPDQRRGRLRRRGGERTPVLRHRPRRGLAPGAACARPRRAHEGRRLG